MKASKDSVGLHNVVICKLLQKLNMHRDMKMLTYLVLTSQQDATQLGVQIGVLIKNVVH